jgi:hypothetical protein
MQMSNAAAGRIVVACAVMITLVALQGCANFNTLERKTWFPGKGNKDSLAIHLDAPQRVVLTDSFGYACAEPSPDALQAYASAVGASVASPASKAASVAAALNTGAGSIGLRTQSITLMRETLYRLCEAARNKSLSPLDVAQLLQRAPDRRWLCSPSSN